MYTLIIAIFIAASGSGGGAHSHSKERPGFKDEAACKTAGTSIAKDLSGSVGNNLVSHAVVVVRTSCVKDG